MAMRTITAPRTMSSERRRCTGEHCAVFVSRATVDTRTARALTRAVVALPLRREAPPLDARLRRLDRPRHPRRSRRHRAEPDLGRWPGGCPPRAVREPRLAAVRAAHAVRVPHPKTLAALAPARRET